MPGLLRSDQSSSSSNEDITDASGPSIRASRIDQAQVTASGLSDGEKPLEEQLEPIAVVGMGCRLPGAVKSASDFWDMMINKRTGNTPKVPASRFNIDAHYHSNNDRPGSFGVLGGYFLDEELTDFDPGLFGITPVEAMWMDPQQRKLLEVVYEALESGGISLEAISGTRTAVFAASFTADWQQMAFKEASFRHSLAATGVDPGIISNRISHVFNLNGPSIVCNTACSSSVYALHNACNALRNNEAEGAIVGGVNLIITVDQHMNTAKLGVLSPTSTCHTFDESADGYGRADAVGAVYLKRLADAVRDGDPIRGIIRSSAVNSNGKVPAVGITHPNREGQADVITHAYERCSLDPRLTGYFECHGTGTAVGDPLEVHAVSMAMNKNRTPDQDPLWIGAVKTNIGHSEAASGLSALIKAILIVERGIIPATRGLVKPSPSIKWDEWQVKVPTEPVPFPAHLPVRRVSINSFGYGGTNAHVVVEGAASMLRGRAPAYKYTDATSVESRRKSLVPRRASHRKRPFLLPFSAHDKATLLRNIKAHGEVAAKYDLLDLSYTLSSRRSVLQSRAFTVASHRTLPTAFEDVAASFSFGQQKPSRPRAIGFVFTGQGAQWPRMGAELMAYSPHFLESIHALDNALEELGDGPEWSIEDVLLESIDTSPVNNAEFSQPLCTAVQIALVQLLAHWGIRPTVTVGHSSGEMAAAYAAGLITAREAIVAAYYRGKVTRDVASAGSMLAVGLGAEAVQEYLGRDKSEGHVVVACHNSPSAVTLSGDEHGIAAVKARLDEDGVFARLVKTSGKAYHSHHMVPVATKYEELIRAASVSAWEDDLDENPAPANARMVSSVTNSILPPGTRLDESYWSKNLTNPVLFNQAVRTILTDDEVSDVDLLIEVGPHSAMAGPIKQIKAELKAEKLDYLPTLLRGTDSAVQLLKLAGELFLRDYPVKMERVTNAYVGGSGSKGGAGTKGHTIVDLPPYQWNYTRPLWAESRASREQRQPKYPRHDVLGQRVIGSSMAEPTWRNVLRLRDLPWLKDHSLGGEAVFPAAGYFAMAIEAITQVHELGGDDASREPIDNYTLRDVSIKKALVTPDDDDGIEVLLNLRPAVQGGGGWWDFSVSSIDMEQVHKEHMAGSIGINKNPRGSKAVRRAPEFAQRATGKAWNHALRQVGFDYGPTFQDMGDIRFDGKTYAASARSFIKQHVDASLGESRYVLHPASVDSVLQLSIAAIYAGRTNAMSCGVVPIQVDEVSIWPPTEPQLQVGTANAYAWVPRRGIRSFEGSAQMTALDGELVLDITNVRTTSYEAAVPQKAETFVDDTSGAYGEMSWDLDIDSLESGADVGSWVDVANLILFKYPALKVLELGTESAAELLSKNPQLSYTAAVGPGETMVAAGKSLVEPYANAKVVPLDPGQDLESQSLKTAGYDVVVAGLEATASVQKLLPKLRGLLKPSGFLVTAPQATSIIEESKGPGDFRLSFRASSGSSVWRPAETTDETRTEVLSPIEGHAVQLVYRTNPSPLAEQIKCALEGLGWSVSVNKLDAFGVDSGGDVQVVAGHVIMLADLEGPVLYTATEAEFLAIRAIIDSASALLWVTSGGLITAKRPEYAMVRGLARSVASEQASLDFRTLDVDLDSTTVPTQVVQSVLRIAGLQASSGDEAPQEREFSLSGGKTYISRLVRNKGLNSIFKTRSDPEPQAFSAERPLRGKVLRGKVVFEQEPERDAHADKLALKAGLVEVQVQAVGLTREGVLVISGSDYPTTFSHEIGGVVTKVGPDVSTLKPGDRVVGYKPDCFASYQQVPATMLHKLADKDDMDAAVSLISAYSNAIYGLETLARVKEGDTVLILHNTGTSGVAAAKIAQDKGATPYLAVKTDAEATFLTTRLGLDQRQILGPGGGAVSTQLGRLTGGRGADVVFSTGSSVDTGSASEAWRHIAPFGRFVDAGRKHVLDRGALDTVPFARGASYLPFDLLDMYESRPDMTSGLVAAVMQLSEQGSITPPGTVEPLHLSQIDKAVSSWSESFGAPKPIIRFEEAPGHPVLTLPPERAGPRFSPDNTYLLVGCLGGLGRSLTAWMMVHGARRFTFLSRSGADSQSASTLVADMESAGAIVQVVRGDATSRSDVVRALEGIPASHPVRGVVHAAMVLRDGMFHSMTFDRWKATVEPKVTGAMNLHSALADVPLDFFLMTSSVSGTLGTPGQSNYAAANSYLDALAHHRVASGKVATSVVLPMVLGVGVVAENTDIEDGLRRMGMYGIDEEQLLEAFEAAIVARQSLDEAPHHIAVGLDPHLLREAMADAGTTEVFWDRDARFSHLARAMSAAKDGADTAGSYSILAAVREADSAAAAVAAVSQHFIEKLSRMLMIPEDNFEPQGPSIASYGIDSMIGAELRNWIFKEYKIDMPFQQLLAPTLSIERFAAQVCASVVTAA
ncbi:hypothetical protein KVR01_006148 [Diaporthe batatas]|uniref:uncharacterized protein n=1 Tax=Diaporthe batatas TaxID=748121 RepID=UPI001D03EBD7|nr:uncharacterized protein KVR01_006148 [Diaporthe batatas]KAG8164230.1 hypothetical protein KVR01_006148 [Diaporthe batatas]